MGKKAEQEELARVIMRAAKLAKPPKSISAMRKACEKIEDESLASLMHALMFKISGDETDLKLARAVAHSMPEGTEEKIFAKGSAIASIAKISKTGYETLYTRMFARKVRHPLYKASLWSRIASITGKKRDLRRAESWAQKVDNPTMRNILSTMLSPPFNQ